MEFRQNIETVESLGISVKEVRAVGGGPFLTTNSFVRQESNWLFFPCLHSGYRLFHEEGSDIMNEKAAAIEESRKLRTHADMYFKEKSPAYRSFQEFAAQAFRPGALETMVKELIAVAISICVKCEPCMDHHVREALRHGATEEQIVEAMEVAMEMGGGPATVQARFALACLELSLSGQ